MINEILVDVLRARLMDLSDKIINPMELDIYSLTASIMYYKSYEDCCEWKDGKPYPEGKERRDRAKQFLLPIVAECGGITEPEDNL